MISLSLGFDWQKSKYLTTIEPQRTRAREMVSIFIVTSLPSRSMERVSWEEFHCCYVDFFFGVWLLRKAFACGWANSNFNFHFPTTKSRTNLFNSAFHSSLFLSVLALIKKTFYAARHRSLCACLKRYKSKMDRGKITQKKNDCNILTRSRRSSKSIRQIHTYWRFFFFFRLCTILSVRYVFFALYLSLFVSLLRACLA